MNVSIIIPNYNGEKILQKNLPNVILAAENYKKGNMEIIISDDNSSDNSIQFISEFVNKNKKYSIKLLTTNVNRGFSSNVNRGVKEAKNDILILLNTDVSPRKDFIDPLVEHFKDDKVFAVGCMDESIENGKTVLRGRGIGSWTKGFLMHSAGDLDKENTLWVSGGSGAFRKSLWDKLSGLDEIFNPFYWEDIDLSYRALKSGYKTIFEKDSVVRHEHEEGVIKKKYSKNKILKVVYRNQFIFVWKNADINNLLLNFIWLPYHILNTVLKGDQYLTLGLISALLKMPQIIMSRHSAVRFFVKSDSQIVDEYH